MKTSAFPAASIWMFRDAPKEYRKLSPHGGDEDWLLACPDRWNMDKLGLSKCSKDNKPIDSIASYWIEKLGISEVSEHRVENGWIYIGTHA